MKTRTMLLMGFLVACGDKENDTSPTEETDTGTDTGADAESEWPTSYSHHGELMIYGWDLACDWKKPDQIQIINQIVYPADESTIDHVGLYLVDARDGESGRYMESHTLSAWNTSTSWGGDRLLMSSDEGYIPDQTTRMGQGDEGSCYDGWLIRVIAYDGAGVAMDCAQIDRADSAGSIMPAADCDK